MSSQILVELQETMGNDSSVARSAWTSTYNKNTIDKKYVDDEKVAKIVRQLALDGHGVPFESVILRFWVRHPIFCDRQIITHRVSSQNGLSGRYRTMPEDYFAVPEDVRDILKKANSLHMAHYYDDICEQASKNYKDDIGSLKISEKEGLITNAEFKRCREILRGQLPTAGMTERTIILNLRSFANFQLKRNSPHAQPEIRQVAELMLQEVEKAGIAPVAIQTLEEVGWKI